MLENGGFKTAPVKKKKKILQKYIYWNAFLHRNKQKSSS